MSSPPPFLSSFDDGAAHTVFKAGDTTYGIFDTFETEEARQAHLNGEIPAALGQVADDLLGAAPDIRTVDVIAVK